MKYSATVGENGNVPRILTLTLSHICGINIKKHRASCILCFVWLCFLLLVGPYVVITWTIASEVALNDMGKWYGYNQGVHSYDKTQWNTNVCLLTLMYCSSKIFVCDPIKLFWFVYIETWCSSMGFIHYQSRSQIQIWILNIVIA